jgi:uncharacterized membrane protein
VAKVRGEVDTSRLETFSDGVFAIAITLLIIGVGIKAEGGSLTYRLAEQWPSYVSYVVSFAIIGILWLHHHEIFRDIRVADHGLFLLNLVFLLGVCFIPFPTKVMGDELASPAFADQRTAVIFYGLTITTISLTFNTVWLWAAYRRRLIEPTMPQVLVRARTRSMWLGTPPYAVATVVAIWSPLSALVLYGIIDLVYMVPSEWLERLVVAEVRRTAEPAPDRETEEVDPDREPQ